MSAEGATGSPPGGFEPVNRADIDLDAMAHNSREIRRIVGRERFIVAALKSNAHGFGLVEVATTVLAAGADAVAVVNLGDAIRLRQAGVTSPVMLYAGPVFDDATAGIADELGLTVTILDATSAAALSSCATKPIDYMVKVDVGLQRIGLYPDDVATFLRSISGLPNLRFRGIYTHMHVIEGDPVADAYLSWQFDRFIDTIAALERAGMPAPLTLAACSSVLMMTLAMNLNAIDPGRLFYGLMPTGPALADAAFRCGFLRLRSRLVQVKPVLRRAYRDMAPFPVRDRQRMGVFPAGRSDGMESLHAGYVLVRGRRAPILMRPSLEHTRIDLTDIPDAAVGDEVVIVGRQGDEEITPADITTRLRMDPGEFAVGLRGSIERHYVPPT